MDDDDDDSETLVSIRMQLKGEHLHWTLLAWIKGTLDLMTCLLTSKG